MSLALNLQLALKAKLRTQRITYSKVAEKLKLSEATIKRDFSRNTLSLERFGAICDGFAISLDALLDHVGEVSELVSELTHAQEKAIVSNPKLWLVAICVLNQWSFGEILERYALSSAEVTKHLLTLDKMGILELHAENRIRLKLARNFRWLPNGAFMQTFRDALSSEFLSADFDDAPDTFRLVTGNLSPTSVGLVREHLLTLAHEVGVLHAKEARVPRAQKQAITLALALRDWEPSVFLDLRK